MELSQLGLLTQKTPRMKSKNPKKSNFASFEINIGLRKSCQDCNWHWMDGRPYTYNKWHFTEPSTPFYECAWARVTLPDFGTWYAKSCSTAYPGYCEYYPNGKPPQFTTDITMPSQGGCKPGWWRYAGYCYKLMGYNSNVENRVTF